MSSHLQNSDRGPWDFWMFAAIFFGFVFAAGGVVVASPGVAVTGLIALCGGLFYFGLQQWLSD